MRLAIDSTPETRSFEQDMRILIVTDAWPPQINGVVRTLQTLGRELTSRGHDVHYFTPEGRRVIRVPSYNEIELSLVSARTIGREIDRLQPDAIHIATEGPLGWAARRACLRRKLPFTTSFHTRFAEYAEARIPLPGTGKFFWSILRNFHKHSQAIMTPSLTITRLLESKGFNNVKTWTRGVDHTTFKPMSRDYFDLPRPLMVVSGRVIIDKNIEAFLRLDLPGTKIVIGDGPDRKMMEQKFPDAVFTGFLRDQTYAHALSSADCFVFPSLTDTFGLVMVEAMACGTPVAAFNVASPIDVVNHGQTGVLHQDLGIAITEALALDRNNVQAGAKEFTWQKTASMFESWLVRIDGAKPDQSFKNASTASL
jgi:glycosyltransferase involved in cell wall biosynthesis